MNENDRIKNHQIQWFERWIDGVTKRIEKQEKCLSDFRKICDARRAGCNIHEVAKAVVRLQVWIKISSVVQGLLILVIFYLLRKI
jgi:hypothetical protein